MTTIDTPTTSGSRVVDLRVQVHGTPTEEPLEALRLAYDERWRLVAGEAVPGAADADLTRNSAQIAALERHCRPQPSVLVRRNGPDPSTFLG